VGGGEVGALDYITHFLWGDPIGLPLRASNEGLRGRALREHRRPIGLPLSHLHRAGCEDGRAPR